MKVSLVSLGCAKNQVDSEHLLTRLGQNVSIVPEADEADVIVVNTCSFIEAAREESVNTILEAGSLGKRLVVFGCLPARYREELRNELPEVEAFFGVDEIDQIADYLAKPGFQNAGSGPDPYGGRRRIGNAPYAYLKIAEGCNHRCSYCAIPAIRGDYRSVPEADLLTEARGLAANGVRELVLVGQDTTAWGTERTGVRRLPDLLRELAVLPIERIRVLYAYPDKVTERLLETMAELPNVCGYLDIPFQHAAPSVLQRMGRPGGVGDPRDVVSRIRATLPEVTLRTTFLVGFPGETEEEFEELLRFVEETRFDRMGAFAFSPEDGTPAVDLPDRVPTDVAEDRLDRLMGLQARVSFEKNRDLVGSEANVLVDEVDGGVGIGRLTSQAPEVDGVVLVRAPVAAGDLIRVRIVEAQDYDLVGEPL